LSDSRETSSPSRPRPRIESLSDLIFGLALSIGAITLIGNPPSNVPDLTTDILTFLFSFMILISVWIRYTMIMSVFPLETRATIFLNTALLFFVSIEPFLFNLMTRFGQSQAHETLTFLDASSSAYALDLGSMMLILGFFAFLLSSEERNLIPNYLLKDFRARSFALFLAGTIFYVSIAPQFFSLQIGGTPVRYLLWIAPFFFSFFRRRRAKKR
jgi:uncharacterized membrane protein